jgi:lipopolysaccharide export system protein LptC
MWWKDRQAANDFVGPPARATLLYNSKVWSYDVNGLLLNFIMTSPRMDRRAGDESLYINHADLHDPSKKPGVPDWGAIRCTAG